MCLQVGVAEGSLLPSLSAEVSGRLGASGVAVGDPVSRPGAESAGREPRQRRRPETRGAEVPTGSGGETSETMFTSRHTRQRHVLNHGFTSCLSAAVDGAEVPSCRRVRLQLRLQTHAGSGPGLGHGRLQTGHQPPCGPVTLRSQDALENCSHFTVF